MQRFTLKLILCFIVISLASCSNDDNEVFVAKIPGKDLKDGQVQIVFAATENNRRLKFNLNEDYNGKIKVEWGSKLDPIAKQYTASGEVYYDFPVQDESYVVTISAPDIKSINFADESVPAIKGLYFGNCTAIEGFSMNGALSNLEVLDISGCSRFWGGSFTIFQNNKNFNFDGLKKAGDIELYTTVSAPINIVGSEIETLRIFPQTDYISKLKIGICPNLNGLSLTKGTNGSSLVRVDTIEIKDTGLKEIYFYAIATGGLDLSETGEGLEIASLQFFDTQETVKWNKSLKRINLNTALNTSNDADYSSNIRSLDFSGCKELEYLMLEYIPSLKDLKIKGLDNLKSVWLQGNSSLEELNVGDMPLLTDFNAFNHKNLKSVTFKNMPLLNRLNITNSKQLTSIQATDRLPLLSLVNLGNDNLDGNQITAFWGQLEDKLNQDGSKRDIKILGNPGDTDAVRTAISKSGNWKIFDGDYPESETKSKSLTPQRETRSVKTPKLMSGSVRK